MKPTADKIVDRQSFYTQISRWKKDGIKVVFTNGCFDILHLGHIEYLERARAFGDRLVVGVNSDDSVTKLKGPGRPINVQRDRAKLLASLCAVDLVTYFSEETPYNLIQESEIDILVKGNDYELANIVGADIVKQRGGEVKTIPLVPGFSTTELIRKMVKNKF